MGFGDGRGVDLAERAGQRAAELPGVDELADLLGQVEGLQARAHEHVFGVQ